METFIYQRPAPPEPERGWPAPARWGAGIGIGCVGLVLAQAALLWAAVGFIVRSRLPQGLKVRAAAPAVVTVGQKFPLSFTVSNSGGKPFTVGALILRKADQQPFTLSNPQPAPSASNNIYNSTTWSYPKTLSSGEKWTVRFDAVATRPGALKSAMDVQIGFLSKSIPFRLQAKPAPAPKAPNGKAPAIPAKAKAYRRP